MPVKAGIAKAEDIMMPTKLSEQLQLNSWSGGSTGH
jgi:hypothetical protein